jgi:hypothetical protein
MTKAAICSACWDIVSPRPRWQTDRSWRWCDCGEVGTRWRDGTRGLLEVTSLHGTGGVLVLGLANTFVHQAMLLRSAELTAEEWRLLHQRICEQVEPQYLFHADKRACWALLVRPGESGDVFLMDYADARMDS